MRHHLMLGWMIVAIFAAAVIAGEHQPNPAIDANATQPSTQPTSQPTRSLASIRRLLAQLAADDYPTRENARVTLMALPRAQLPDLRQAVIQSLPLQPSQVTVLRDIVTQIYLAGDAYVPEADGRGFLGVHLPYFPEDRVLLNMERGVVVISRVPGFCAYRMLQDGDILLSMDAPSGGTIAFNTNEQLIAAVQGVKAGQTLTFEVLRQGRIIEVPITLDRKPINLTPTQIEEFIGRREDRASELWDRDFAPLLAERLG